MTVAPRTAAVALRMRVVLLSEGEAFDMDVTGGDAGGADGADGRVGHPGRAADVDVALDEVGHELVQVLGGEQALAARRRVVAGDEVDGAPERGELVGEQRL